MGVMVNYNPGGSSSGLGSLMNSPAGQIGMAVATDGASLAMKKMGNTPVGQAFGAYNTANNIGSNMSSSQASKDEGEFQDASSQWSPNSSTQGNYGGSFGDPNSSTNYLDNFEALKRRMNSYGQNNGGYG